MIDRTGAKDLVSTARSAGRRVRVNVPARGIVCLTLAEGRDEDTLVGVAVVAIDVASLRPADLDAGALDVLHALRAALLDGLGATRRAVGAAGLAVARVVADVAAAGLGAALAPLVRLGEGLAFERAGDAATRLGECPDGGRRKGATALAVLLIAAVHVVQVVTGDEVGGAVVDRHARASAVRVPAVDELVASLAAQAVREVIHAARATLQAVRVVGGRGASASLAGAAVRVRGALRRRDGAAAPGGAGVGVGVAIVLLAPVLETLAGAGLCMDEGAPSLATMICCSQ